VSLGPPPRRYSLFPCKGTLLAEVRKAAESEGVARNKLITVALAERVSAMRTKEYFEERARRADPAKVSRILARVGKGNPPIEGDELPLEFAARDPTDSHEQAALASGWPVRRQRRAASNAKRWNTARRLNPAKLVRRAERFNA
jgi:hypothetical protein